MKKFTLLLALLMFVGFSFAQERVYDEDTIIYITTEEGVRIVTSEEMWGEFDDYEAQTKINNNAHNSDKDMGIGDGENAEEHYVVPMLNTETSELAKQKQEFDENTTDYVQGPAEEPSRNDFSAGYNNSWGIPAIFEAYIDAIITVYGDQATRTFHAHFIAGGKVFGQDMKALEFNADMSNNAGSPTASASLRIFGQTYWQSNEIKLFYKNSWNKEYSWTYRFMIGPIPVSVTATVGGTLGIDLSLQLAGEGLGIVAAGVPSVLLYGSASAQVDIVIAKAGVEGTIVFLENHLTISASVFYVPVANTLQLVLTVTDDLLALKGKITIFAAIRKPWGGWKKFSKVLFQWDGIKKEWTIFKKNKTITFD